MQNQELNDGEAQGTGKVVVPTDEGEQIPLTSMSGGLESEGTIGDGGGFEEPKKGVPPVALVLLVVIAVGGGVMWAMSATGHKAPADGASLSDETKIEAALKKLVSAQPGASNLDHDSFEAIFSDSKRFVELFSDDPAKHQVSLDELAKNPFQLSSGEVKGAEAPSTDFQRQEVMSRLGKEHAALQLQSVLTGSQSLAVISGKVVRVGDVIGSFTVKAIEPGRVVLRAEGVDFELEAKKPGVVNE